MKRTFHAGLKLVSQGGGEWKTEDGAHGVSYQRAGYTFCENQHPVPISPAMAAAARENPRRAWAVPIMEALRQGKRGYWCPGNQEHEGEWAWIPWSNHAGADGEAHACYDTLVRAADSLGKALEAHGQL